MKLLRVLIFTLFLLTMCGCIRTQNAVPVVVSPCLPTTATPIQVIRVIDGDTIVIEGGYRVRYIGIDTPEIHPRIEACGIEAWEANRRLVEGKEVCLERDVSETDKYDRLLRYVYVDGLFVNGELVKQGLAKVLSYPPDTKYDDFLKELEAEARESGRGMWSK